MDWSAFWGAFLGTLLNLVEMGMLVMVLRNLNKLLNQLGQFKSEGEDDKWLK